MKRTTDYPEFSVIGAGRFGLFWGNHLSVYYPTSFYDLRSELKSEVKSPARWQSLKHCLQKDFIFLTLPIGQIREFLKQNGTAVKTGAVIIDCASVKKPVLNWFAENIPEHVFYAASHPLFGPDSARGGLAQHLMMLIPGRIPLARYNFLVNFFSGQLGLQVLSMTAEEHDHLMAYNLSLVHHLGRTLSRLGVSELPLKMAGMKKLCEITQAVMNDSEELFRDFYLFNPYATVLKKNFLSRFKQVSVR
jgi:prephenate dehydrogenase